MYVVPPQAAHGGKNKQKIIKQHGTLKTVATAIQLTEFHEYSRRSYTNYKWTRAELAGYSSERKFAAMPHGIMTKPRAISAKLLNHHADFML